MRSELEIPLQFAGVGIQRHYAVAVEIVAAPVATMKIGAGISHAPVGQIRNGIIRPCHPDRGAAVHPGITGPGLMSGLARSRNRVEAPSFPTGSRIVGCDVTADAIFATRHANDDLI